MGQALSAGQRIVDLVTEVITDARSSGPRIGLPAVRDLCIAKARLNNPDLVSFLSTTRGMAAIAVTLSRLPHIVKADNDNMTQWTFIRTLQ